ncbi:hypothetical protein GCM10009654_15310 [Streptomyces hebeiensis]|uniref:Uncharacterized protein n=1 Tax=Streptomyces hebeiensis TaxID=229486 RepID=A0ABN1UP09_9ACTN
MPRLQQFLGDAAEFSHALDTVQGRRIGARLDTLGQQFGFLAREIRTTAEDLDATVAVLTPDRTPTPPRVRPYPAVPTAPPLTPPQRTTTAVHRA